MKTKVNMLRMPGWKEKRKKTLALDITAEQLNQY